MPNATIQYVTWISRGRRHHGSAYAEIAPTTTSTLTAGDSFQPPWAPPSISWTDGNGKQQTANFGFWSVTGGTDGGVVSKPNTITNSYPNTTPPVTVGNSPIVATAWYIQGGGNGKGVPGVSIDAFDVNQGMFVDDDFVAVTTDPGLSTSANEDGFVSSTEAENIEAFDLIHAVPFDDWNVVQGQEAVSDLDLGVTINSNAVAFAFYQKLDHSLPKGKGLYEQVTHIYFGVINDGPGLTDHGPVGPWDPFVKQLAAGVALAVSAGYVNSKLKNELLKVAATQVTLSAEAIVQSIKSVAI